MTRPTDLRIASRRGRSGCNGMVNCSARPGDDASSQNAQFHREGQREGQRGRSIRMQPAPVLVHTSPQTFTVRIRIPHSHRHRHLRCSRRTQSITFPPLPTDRRLGHSWKSSCIGRPFNRQAAATGKSRLSPGLGLLTRSRHRSPFQRTGTA